MKGSACRGRDKEGPALRRALRKGPSKAIQAHRRVFLDKSVEYPLRISLCLARTHQKGPKPALPPSPSRGTEGLIACEMIYYCSLSNETTIG